MEKADSSGFFDALTRLTLPKIAKYNSNISDVIIKNIAFYAII